MIRLDDFAVLVVDDEREVRDVVRMALETRGARVETVGSGREARESLRHFAPKAVVSDLMMPEEDGYQLVESVRRLGILAPTVGLVALSAFGTPHDRRRARRAGFGAYVVKPATAEALAKAIHEALAVAAADGDEDDRTSAARRSSGVRRPKGDSGVHHATFGAQAIDFSLLSFHRSSSGAVRVEMPGGRVVATFESMGIGKNEWRIGRVPGGLSPEDAQRAFEEWTAAGRGCD